MILSEFISENQAEIISEWEMFAKTLSPAADSMSQLQLKDHIVEILDFIAKDLKTSQTALEQKDKSHGASDSTENDSDTAAEIHGSLRHNSGFNIVQMVSEYRALRSSVIRLWTNVKRVLEDRDVLDLTRFNESIDQALAESVVKFMEKVDYSKDLLLGVLGHDIRSPLGAMTTLTKMMGKVGPLNEKQDMVIEQMSSCGTRVTGIVSDLLDLTRARMGTNLPVIKQKMNIVPLAKEIIEEIAVQFPGRKIDLETMGNLEGEWDSRRLGQVFSNLLSNAIQYGTAETPINLKLEGQKDAVVISVHNSGIIIPAENLKAIFKSFARGTHHHSPNTSNLGLGLFIAKEIVTSHNGKISVISDERNGTVFTITLPR